MDKIELLRGYRADELDKLIGVRVEAVLSLLERREQQQKRRRLRKLLHRVLTEVVRFTTLMAGTSLFAFLVIPTMERASDRVVLMAEVVVLYGFALWLGSKIYGK